MFNEPSAMQDLEQCLRAGDAEAGYKLLVACMGEWVLPCSHLRTHPALGSGSGSLQPRGCVPGQS